MLSVRYYCQISVKIENSLRTEISLFMKIRPVGTELFHADGQVDVET